MKRWSRFLVVPLFFGFVVLVGCGKGSTPGTGTEWAPPPKAGQTATSTEEARPIGGHGAVQKMHRFDD